MSKSDVEKDMLEFVNLIEYLEENDKALYYETKGYLKGICEKSKRQEKLT